MKNKNLIINPYFLLGLVLLLINDLYLKYEYGNVLTGKLSDFAGLLIFPMFVAFIIPKLKKSISLITGIVFILWKTPLFTPVIDFANQLLSINVHRVIDYTDYIALLILPISHYLINNCNYEHNQIKKDKIKSGFTYLVSFIAFFAFCSTSMFVREIPKGSIYIGKSYNIKLSKDSIINTINNLGYNCIFNEGDSLHYRKIGYYQTDNIVRYYIQDNDSVVLDTIANIKYQLEELKPNKTKLTIINVTLTKEGNIQDWKNLKYFSKQYEMWLKENLIQKID